MDAEAQKSVGGKFWTDTGGHDGWIQRRKQRKLRSAESDAPHKRRECRTEWQRAEIFKSGTNRGRAPGGKDAPGSEEKEAGMMQAYCMWFGKFLEDIAEHEQDQCHENEQECDYCGNLTFKEREEGEHGPIL